MVKSLLIRQAFVVIDLTLALLVAFVIYLIASQQLEARTPPVPPSTPAGSEGSDIPKVSRVGRLDSYDVIAKSGLFGPAGQSASGQTLSAGNPEFIPPPPTLTLHATAASEDPGDPLATAVIENSAAPTVQKVATYYHGQPVSQELYLKYVYPRKVVLENQNDKKLSELVMPDSTKAPAAPGPGAAGRLNRPERLAAVPSDATALNRDEVVQEMASYDYADVVNTLNPQMAEDANGNVTGITSDNFASVPLAGKIGLQNGDVVNTVNGIKIDSDQKLIEIFNKFGNANTFRLGVTRNGAPVMLTFKLE